MCDDFIHQGLTHDPTVSRRAFVVSSAASVVLSSASAAAQAKVMEKDVNVPMASGVSDSALFYPEGKGPWPGVLVWTDILGLRPVFREMGRRLAAEGYVVLVPNPFYRSKKAPIVTGPFDFNDRKQIEPLMQLKATLTDAAIDKDAAAFLSFLDAQKQTNRRKGAGVQGYCFSGPFAFRTGAVRSDRIR